MNPHDPLEPFAEDGELARLLRAERSAPGPTDREVMRGWGRLSHALATPPVRAWPAGKLLFAVAVVAAVVVGWKVSPRGRPNASVLESHSTEVAFRVAAPMVVTVPTVVTHRVPPSRPRVIDSLAEERALIEAARLAIAHGEPREASARLAIHAQRFPHGQLREERESLAIRAELVLGRPAVAEARADAFLRTDPESMFAPVVRALADRAKAIRGP